MEYVKCMDKLSNIGSVAGKTEEMRGSLRGHEARGMGKVEGMRELIEREWRALGICGVHILVGRLRRSAL